MSSFDTPACPRQRWVTLQHIKYLCRSCIAVEGCYSTDNNQYKLYGNIATYNRCYCNYKLAAPFTSSLFNGVARGGHAPQSREIRVVGNGGPITGCLIHRVTKYRGYKDARVRLSFLVVPFRKENCHRTNRIKLGILHFCGWLQPKS